MMKCKAIFNQLRIWILGDKYPSVHIPIKYWSGGFNSNHKYAYNHFKTLINYLKYK